MKSSVDEIRARFDADVDRFSNLETGQAAAIDSTLCMNLISSAAVATGDPISRVLDIGCGAGNYTISLLRSLAQRTGQSPEPTCTLLDLSQPMLDRARQRVEAETPGAVTTIQTDVRDYEPEDGSFDAIMAAAVFHHLRDDQEWDAVFARLHAALRPGGWLWIVDLIHHQLPAVHELMRGRYADYLDAVVGPDFRVKAFDYIEAEDTPDPWSGRSTDSARPASSRSRYFM
ncbi:MAG: class I SAM-dependent methyltransferase [Phycisphaeraceae bacterium]